MKEGKYAKTLAKILVTAIFLMRDTWRNFLPKFIEICMETPCWCPSVWTPTWRPKTKGAFHSTKNFEMFETGTNGTEISWDKFQKIRKLLNFEKQTIQPKIPEIPG